MPTRPTKDWQDSPSTATPIDAAALEDADDRGFDYTDDSVAEHSADTTSVHGIADTSALATDAELAAHAADGTSVHGIADTADLVDTTDLANHAADATSVHGILDAAGYVVTYKTSAPTDGSLSNGEAAWYLDATTGSPKWKIKDSSGTVSVWDFNDFLQKYLNAKGDLFVSNASAEAGYLAVGSNDQVLTADSAQTLGVKWASVTVADGFVTAAKVNTTLKPSGTAASTDESLRRLGTGATHAAAGDDSRFPTSGQKNALAGTSGTPGTGNEYATKATTDALQPLDSDLTAIAALTTTSFGRALLATADAAAVRTAISAQGLDATLTALAGLATGADKFPYSTGTDAFSQADLTAAGRALLDDADASAQLTTLGVSTFIKTLLDDTDASTARTTLGVAGAPTIASLSNWWTFAPISTGVGSEVGTTTGMVYVLGIFVPVSCTLTGILALSGPTVNGTAKACVGFYNAAGTLVANSNLAGQVVTGASTWQKIPFTGTYSATGPALYFASVQLDGTGTRFRHVNPTDATVSGYLAALTQSVAGTFGTLPSLTPPTGPTATIGPVLGTY